MSKVSHYEETLERISALITIEGDWIAAIATADCELHHTLTTSIGQDFIAL